MYVSLHNHTAMGSNTRGFLDSINRVEDLIDYTFELGHKGIAITDHDCITAHMPAIKYLAQVKKEDPEKWKDYKLILGNEIYLCSKKQILEDKDYQFYHFILLAKDLIGHKQIRELSTRAWVDNSFTWVNIRTPTYFEDLFEVVESDRGHLMAGSACLGGQLPKMILKAYEQNSNNPDLTLIKKWIKRMVKCFGEGNFYLELQPSKQEAQTIVNRILIQLANEFDLPYVITTDAHYLKKEDRPIHEAFLKSNEDSGKEREVGEFYATTYVMNENEIHEYLDETLGQEVVQKGLDNSILFSNQVEEYTLAQPLQIPYEPHGNTEPDAKLINKYKKYIPLIEYFGTSEHQCNRHLAKLITERIEKDFDELGNKKTYDAIEDCLNTVKITSDKQKTQWAAYFLQTKDLVDACWAVGSLVGPSRGSGLGFVLLYILGITQINPLKEEVETFPWRFLNPQRVSVPDVDVDFMNEKRDDVINYLQHQYCGEDEKAGKRRVVKVQTLLTMKSKNAILTACRGLGVSAEEAQFLSSFIGQERGIQHTLKQTFYGDENNNISPNTEFANLMTEKYPQVWEVAQKIEGLVSGVGSHAGGVILTPSDIVNYCALMKTASGDIITQFDLHLAEECGLIKFDLLSIDALLKIKICLNLLLEDGYIEWQGSLKDTYEKYVGVYNIERDNPKIWNMIDHHEIISFFQMEKQSGIQAISIAEPKSLTDLSALNSVMRLMAPEPGAESPLERYGRFRKDITLWYKEMKDYGLTEHEQKIVRKYTEKTYGLLPNQEDFMLIVQDPEIGGFDLLWSDRLRKAISKKAPKDYAQLQVEFYQNIEDKHLSPKLCHYVWDVLIAMNRGYGFNKAHTLAYSIVGLQEANLAYHYPIVYWNCANLIADSGGEDGNTNYDKIAKAVSNFQKKGIKITLPNINKAKFNFSPDAKNNEIIYGLKPIQKINTKVAKAIIDNRPYTSAQDFYQKMQNYKASSEEAKFGDTAMITLIKAGCFDELEHKSRTEVMADFIRSISNPVKKLQVSNIEDLNALGLLTPEQKKYELRLVRFKKYLFQKQFFAKQTGKSPTTAYYKLDRKFAEPWFYEHFETDMTEGKDYEYDDEGYIIVKRGSIERVFDKLMANFKETVLTNPEYLDKLNQSRFENNWKEMAPGTISQWEMESLCYYYSGHELAGVRRDVYGIANFDELPTQPEIADTYFYRGQEKARFKLSRICGTVIGKDKNKHTVALLTPDGVVEVKFYKGQFGFYDKQIVELNDDGTKTRLEESWFSRGTKLMITGFRREEQFVPRKYKDSIYNHSVQLIKSIDENGILTLQSERAGQEE